MLPRIKINKLYNRYNNREMVVKINNPDIKAAFVKIS